MFRRPLLTACCAVLAVVVSARAFDPVTLAWKPQAGAVHKYTQKSTADNVQGQALTINCDMTETIKAVNPDSTVDVEEVDSNIQVLLGGNPLPGGAAVPTTITTKRKDGPDGHVISKQSDQQGDSPRVDNAAQMVMPDHPVNVGDTWTYKGKADPDKQTYDYEIDFTYKGVETVDGVSANKVELKFKEMNVPGGATAVTADGNAWLDPADGELVKEDVKVQNAPLGPLGTTNLSVTVERK